MLLAPVPEFETAKPQLADVVRTIRFAELLRLDEELAEVDLVVTPLIGRDFDAFELIDRLGMTEFRGVVRVVVERLPDPAMVLNELRAIADPLAITVELVGRRASQAR